MTTNIRKFLDSLKLKPYQILEQIEDRLIYAHGVCPYEYKWMLQGPYKYVPEAILVPESAEEVGEILKKANEFKVGVIPYGGGSGSVAGTVAERGEVMLDVKQLLGISINEKNCTAEGGAGVTGAEFENYLNIHGYTCGNYPQSFQSAVLGGMAATRAVGTFSTKYGKMDDIVNSLEAVLPDGQIVRTHKAPKRSTGPELNQLFLGSEGVYGIITKVECKIYPLPQTRYFEAYTFPETSNGLEAIREFLQMGINPAVLRLYDHEESVAKINKYGFEEGWSFLIVGYEHLEDIVNVQKKIVRETCLKRGGVSKGETPGKDWFNSRFSTKKIQDSHALTGGTSDAIEVAAPWDCIETVWREMRKALEPLCNEVECHFSHFYHTGASVYVIFYAESGGNDFDGEELYLKCARTAIETSLKHGGNISHHHGVGKLKGEYMDLEHGKEGLYVMRKIKEALDPGKILNEGVLGI
jgi:alkyldihydroxyacetonephosphate synthase